MPKHLSISEIETLISQAPYWHHRIELAPGVFTPGMQDTQALLLQVSFPEDLTGKRVLDIGARDGFFSRLKQNAEELERLLRSITFPRI